MSAAKLEQLIDLIINEDQDRAEQLFHEIVIQKSREIYESLMADEMAGDQTGGLLDEIEAEESDDLTMEADEDMPLDDAEMDMDDAEDDMDDAEMDMDDAEDDMDDAGMGSEEPATKADIMNIEDKLDELMAEFEAMMNDEGDEEADDEEADDEEADDEEAMDDEESMDDEEESGVMEAVEMKKVSVTHTDGADSGAKKGPIAANSGATGMASKPVKFSGSAAETGRSTPSSTTTNMKFKNAPGANGSKSESAPKPVTKQASGVNVKDIVPESKQVKKKIIK